jgi:hypothetical protein
MDRTAGCASRLTEAGTRKLEAFLPGHIAELVDEFSVLSASEQLTLAELCKKLGKGSRASDHSAE